MNHSIIAVFITLGFIFIGHPWGGLVATGYYFAGREIAQAEYRWMAAQKTNRNNMPWYAIFTKIAWTFKGLVLDLTIPIVISAVLAFNSYAWTLG